MPAAVTSLVRKTPRQPWAALLLISCGTSAVETAAPSEGGMHNAAVDAGSRMDASFADDGAQLGVGDDAATSQDGGDASTCAPAAELRPGTWTALALPSAFDLVGALDGTSATDFFVVAISGYTPVLIRPIPPLVPMVWHVQGTDVTDVTPAPLQVDAGLVATFDLVALGTNEYWLFSVFDDHTALYDVTGTTAVDITPAAFTTIGPTGSPGYADVLRRTSNGDVFLGGSDSQGEALLLHASAGAFATIPVPHDAVDAGASGDAVTGIAELSGAVYATTRNGRLFLIDDDQLSLVARAPDVAPPGHPGFATMQATSTSLFVLDSSGLGTTQVQRWNGTAFVTECVPSSDGEVQRLVPLQDDTVAALREGEAWVRGADGVWKTLPPADVDRMWGSAGSSTYAFPASGSAGTISLLP